MAASLSKVDSVSKPLTQTISHIMSTRAAIHFVGGKGGKPTAIVYRHNDGYPDGLGLDLRQFVADVKEHCPDTRFTDPSYLAAKWVVWDADNHARSNAEFAQRFAKQFPHMKADDAVYHPLKFLSVGIVDRDPGDIEYRYHVICDGKPTLTCQDSRSGESQPIPELEGTPVPAA